MSLIGKTARFVIWDKARNRKEITGEILEKYRGYTTVQPNYNSQNAVSIDVYMVKSVSGIHHIECDFLVEVK